MWFALLYLVVAINFFFSLHSICNQFWISELKYVAAVTTSDKFGLQFAKNKKLSIIIIVIVCVAAIAISKIFLGGLWYWRRTRQRNVCEIKLSGTEE